MALSVTIKQTFCNIRLMHILTNFPLNTSFPVHELRKRTGQTVALRTPSPESWSTAPIKQRVTHPQERLLLSRLSLAYVMWTRAERGLACLEASPGDAGWDRVTGRETCPLLPLGRAPSAQPPGREGTGCQDKRATSSCGPHQSHPAIRRNACLPNRCVPEGPPRQALPHAGGRRPAVRKYFHFLFYFLKTLT